ncbi:MAG: hypothetical protein ACYCZR_10255 [Burkholderiales bacterium]
MSKLRPVLHSQKDGVSANTYAALLGISPQQVIKYCRNGRIIGARKDPLTKRWWIYPPAKLVPGRWS